MTAMSVADVAATAAAPLGALLARVAGGDSGALGELYDLVAADLFALALWRSGSREDAADAVQDVFVRLARTPETVARVRSPRSYLLAMAHRAVIDIARRRRHDVPIEESLLEPVCDGHEGRLDAARLSRLLATLPEAQREAVYLRHFAALTFAEIARVTGVSLFTAASRYRLGVARLRRLLGVYR
jgi:RNA polymerase sigma-70 factor, ECF subfamily